MLLDAADRAKTEAYNANRRRSSSAGSSLPALPWAGDVPMKSGDILARPGDLLVVREAEVVCYVIPKENGREVMNLLPMQKLARDALLGDIRGSIRLKLAIQM